MIGSLSGVYGRLPMHGKRVVSHAIIGFPLPSVVVVERSIDQPAAMQFCIGNHRTQRVRFVGVG